VTERLLATATLCAVLLVLVLRYGAGRATLVASVGTLTVGGLTLFRFGGDATDQTVGIASAVPGVTTYGSVLLIAGLALLLQGKWRAEALWLLPLGVFVVFGMLALWPHTPAAVSGALHVVTVVCAWAVGAHLGRSMRPDGATAAVCARVMLAVTLFLAVAVAYQLLTGTADGGRASGIFTHPSVVGKMAVILTGVLLPLSQSTVNSTRKQATLSIALCLAMTAPTLSRANIVALAIVMSVWAVLLPGARNLRRKVVLLVVFIAALVPVSARLFERFASDTAGGDRPELLAAGIRQIVDNPLAGTGPNQFVQVVRLQEWIVAVTGYPVHNSFLLVAAELGAVGALLLLVPLARLLLASFRRCREAGPGGDFARGAIAMLLGVTFVGMTGWGLLQQPVTELLFLVAGLLTGQVRGDRTTQRLPAPTALGRRSSAKRSSLALAGRSVR
jgi:O-antigen ligase